MSNGRYRAYPEYKDSGVEWIGQLPNDWKVTRIKFCASLNSSKTELNHIPRETEVTFLPMEAIGEHGELDTSRTKMLSEVSSGYTYLAENDVCIAKITPCFENGKGAIVRGLKNGLAFATTEVVPLRCQSENVPEFLYYLLTSAPFNKQAEGSMYGAGGQKRVADSFVANYHFAKPPLPEQTQIAKFLDHETAKIDRLIEKQEELIRLLKEKRQAVISHAVTKGLNPHAPLKDSGIPWLGQIPAHWTVSKIKYVAEVESGHTPDKKVEAYWTNCDIPWVSLNDSTQLKEVDYISDTAFYINEKGIANSSARRLPAQAVIFTRDASIGLAAITTREMAVSQHIIAWICDPQKVIPEYLLLVFYAMAAELERYTFGATIKTIGMSDVNTLVGAFPGLNEQKQIADHVFALKAKLTDALTRAEKLIHTLQERRAALISAAVTGKIDVRHWQPAGSDNH